jgi:AhpD family alkylhydroperoxidase
MSKLVKHVRVIHQRNADGVVAEVYSQSRSELGRLVEPVMIFSTVPDLLVASWVAFRETVVAQGLASRSAKEAVAAAVSQLNACAFCVDAHSIMLDGCGARDLAARLLEGRPEAASDQPLGALALWARQISRRPPSRTCAPFPAAQTPELLGTLVHFHFLTRVMNVLVPRTFLPGPPLAHGVVRRIAGKVLSRYLRRSFVPGDGTGLAEVGAPLPADLSWAAPQPHIARAFSQIACAAAESGVPPTVRRLVEAKAALWSGDSLGISTSWATEAAAALPPSDRPAGRLALLVAFASAQVSDLDVAAFRALQPLDSDLLGLLAWSAFTAARQIGEWAAPAALWSGETKQPCQ